MPKPRGTLVVAAAVLLACAPSAQVRAQATVERAELPNDIDNFLGDRIRFAVKTKAKLRSDPQQEVCVPALTRMSVIGKIETTKQLVVKIGGGCSAGLRSRWNPATFLRGPFPAMRHT
jgi:hypothetical protein